MLNTILVLRIRLYLVALVVAVSNLEKAECHYLKAWNIEHIPVANIEHIIIKL